MSWKVKRGLGLLVIAVIGWLIGLALINAPVDGGLTGVLVVAALLVSAIAAVGGLVGGLGLVAWGLLRD